MIKTNDFMDIMKGRRSIRNYDPTVRISKEEMTEILEEATTAPSSVNAQPWRFLVIDSPEGKEKSRRWQALTKHRSQLHLPSSLFLQT